MAPVIDDRDLSVRPTNVVMFRCTRTRSKYVHRCPNKKYRKKKVSLATVIARRRDRCLAFGCVCAVCVVCAVRAACDVPTRPMCCMYGLHVMYAVWENERYAVYALHVLYVCAVYMGTLHACTRMCEGAV